MLRWVLCFCVFFTLVFSNGVFAAACNTKQSPKHYEFPFVIKSQDLYGFSINGFAGYVYRNGEWERIPLQIDEVNSRGDYVLEEGLPFTKDTDDGFFDANDELVIDGSYLGVRASLKQFPQKLLQNVTQKWWVDLCGKDYHGSFLLVYYTHDRPFFFPTTPVIFDKDNNIVKSDQYQYHFHPEQAALLGEVFLVSRDQGKQRLLQKSDFVMPLFLPWYLPNVNFTNNSFTSSIESWRVGPIRTIVAVGVKLRGFLSLFDFHMFSELVFYRNKFEVPTMIEFTFEPVDYFKQGSGIAYSVKFDQNIEWPLTTNMPDFLESDTGMKQNMAPTEEFVHYSASSGNQLGSFLLEVRVDEKAAALVPPPRILRGEVLTDKKYRKEYPWLKDLSGDLGVFIDFSQVRKGIYKFGLDLFLSSEASIERIAENRPSRAYFQKQ